MVKKIFLVPIVVFLFILFIAPSTPSYAKGYEGELLSIFSTSYQSSSEGRRHNVELASRKINGTVLKEGEVFSFNGVTGERTIENGYKSSPIIEKGEFVLGVGGGVCQVSTTLYNAVIRAGLRVITVSPHSLPVSYVPPSMDAMVSTATDFRFKNTTPYPITIKSEAKGGCLTFKIYGFKMITDGEQIIFRSETVSALPYEYEERIDKENLIPEGEDFLILKEGKSGLISRSYKDIYFSGKLISSVKIREDHYKAQKGVKLVRDESNI